MTSALQDRPILLLLLCISCLDLSHGFVPSSFRAVKQSSYRMPAAAATGQEGSDDSGNEKDNDSSSGDDILPSSAALHAEDDEDDPLVYIGTKVPTAEDPSWDLGNSLDQFLNQCTVQSFLFLLRTCRDPHTVLWVERFTQPLIAATTTTPSTVDTNSSSTTSKLLTYHGLCAMNTTAFPTWKEYFTELLQQPHEQYTIESTAAHVPTYEMEVNPPSLCARMISVRDQLAREFASDLRTLAKTGRAFLEQYRRKEQQTSAKGDPLRTGQAGADLLFLETLGNPDDYRPSPLRKGNFDLLVLLTTQESIHRVLNTVDKDILDARGRQCLGQFYLPRIVSHFEGRQRYGRWNDFLMELSQQSFVSTEGDADTPPMEGIRLVQAILEIRREVALEWAEHATDDVPQAHMEIKRLQLDLLMKSYGNNPSEEEAFQ